MHFAWELLFGEAAKTLLSHCGEVKRRFGPVGAARSSQDAFYRVPRIYEMGCKQVDIASAGKCACDSKELVDARTGFGLAQRAGCHHTLEGTWVVVRRVSRNIQAQ